MRRLTADDLFYFGYSFDEVLLGAQVSDEEFRNRYQAATRILAGSDVYDAGAAARVAGELAGVEARITQGSFADCVGAEEI